MGAQFLTGIILSYNSGNPVPIYLNNPIDSGSMVFVLPNDNSPPVKKTTARVGSFTLLIVFCIVVSGIPFVQGTEEDTENQWNEGLVVQVTWDTAPFNVIQTLCTWNNELYAAGRYSERIFKSADGVTWAPAFDVHTSYSWEASIVYNGSLYFGSSENRSNNYYVNVWRSTNGTTLEKVFESEPSSEQITSVRRFSIYNGTLALGMRGTGSMIRSHDGTHWERFINSTKYSSFNDLIEYKGSYYITAGSSDQGGALFRSSDGEEWNVTTTWTNGIIDYHSVAGNMVVFNDTLYVCHNGDKESSWGVVLGTLDGENFTEVWHGEEDHLNYVELTVFEDRLFLTLSGISLRNLGGEIRVFHEGETENEDTFVRIHDGNDNNEHHFHGQAVFMDALFIGGGSGKGGSGNAILYRITNRDDEDPLIEIPDGELPFGTVFVLTEFQGYMYTAGRWYEKVYRSQDGENWEPAFSNTTTYSWQNGITFEGALYLVSCEGEGDRRTTILWRSSNGSSLAKVFEIENGTTERPALGIHNDFLYMGVEQYVNDSLTGCLYRSDDGSAWGMIFQTDIGYRFQEFRTFQGAFYFTMSGVYCGGSLFRSFDGSEFELAARWNESVDYGDNGAYGLCVYDNELYVTLNHDGGAKYVRVLKSSNGTTFHEIWSTTGKDMNAARVCVFDGRLYLYICGKMGKGQGSEIWYQDGETFVLLHKGNPDREHTLLRNLKFGDSLYIGGGSGNWNSHDAIIHRIGYFVPKEEEEEVPIVDDVGNGLPFGTVFVLTEFQGDIYAAGRWYEKVYRSSDGEDWEPAFSQTTSYSWQNGITFEESLYILSCEGEGERRTTVLWRSNGGSSLDRVYEIEDTTTSRPAFGIFNGSLYMGVEQYVDGDLTGCLYRSDIGSRSSGHSRAHSMLP